MTENIRKPRRQERFKGSSFRKAEAQVAEGSYSRAAAAMCVDAVEQGRSLSEALPFFTKDLDPRDKALVQEIAYGTLRHRRLIANTANDLLNHSINLRFNKARVLILCGIYQIIFTRAPAHAAVAATVGACKLCGCGAFTGLINAVLRRFLREGAHLKHSVDPAIEQSFPDWMFELFKADYPDSFLQIAINSNERAPMWIRVENSKISTSAYLEKLDSLGIAAHKDEFLESAVKLDEPIPSESLPGFKLGLVSIQDYAAQWAAPLLDLKDGMTVLDCCCAPGGKSAHILDICPNVKLYCLDIDETRLEEAKKQLLRLGRTAIFAAGDCRTARIFNDETFDRILVDAPCSGTGVIRRHPDIKWLRRKKDLQVLQNSQQEILDRAFSKLKNDGILLYTTCSILKDENERQILNFLKRQPLAQLHPFKIQGQETAMFQRLPGDHGGDGFFYARIIKK